MATEVEKLRIVCTKCPAIATVHFQEHSMAIDGTLVWMECHGEHRFVSFSGERAVRFAGRDLLWSDGEPEDVQAKFEIWEARLVECEERLALYRRIVEATRCA